MKRLKEKWNIQSNVQLMLILIVFAITGSTSAWVAKPVTELLGITQEMEWFIYWPIRILIIFPLYQVLLVCIGWIFGQFKFFWNFEKKMLKRMGLGFVFTE